LVISAAPCVAGPISELVFTDSEAGFYGGSYSWNPTNSVAQAFAYHNNNYPVDTVAIFFGGTGSISNTFADIIFSTRNVPGQALVPGTYTWPTRYLGLPNQPGLEIAFNSHGFEDIFGTVNVLEEAFDFSQPQPQLLSFAATFDVQADTAHIVGHVYFNFTPNA